MSDRDPLFHRHENRSAHHAPVTLLGTVITPSGAHALIHLDGEVARVGVGDTIGAARVIAIDEATLVLGDGARAAQVLSIPG